MSETTKIAIERVTRKYSVIGQTSVRIIQEAIQGIPGPAGSSTTTVINIGVPSLMWNLAHYLGRYPSVTIVDSGGNDAEADVRYIDQNVIQVYFTVPVSGTAYLN